MTAKDYLRQVRQANYQADKNISRLEHFREAACYGTGRKEAERISGSTQRSRVEENVCRMIDLERRLQERGLMVKANQAVDAFVDRRQEATAIICRIPQPQYRELLMLYYIDGLEWHQVASVQRCSLRHAFRVHGSALVAFDQLWKEVREK